MQHQRISRGRIVMIGFTLALLIGVASGVLAEDGSPTLQGLLTAVWADPAPGADSPPRVDFLLRDDKGAAHQLVLSAALVRRHGGIRALNGSYVEVRLRADKDAVGRNVLTPTWLRVLTADKAKGLDKAVTGSQPWITLPCKFPDIATEPKNLAFFTGMCANSFPGLDHYWRAQSYDAMNVQGSGAIDWVTLPSNRSTYLYPDPGGSGDTLADLDALFDDCTAAADAQVYFPTYVGINMMFNDTIGTYAWGGSQYATLDSTSGVWRVTWEPPWGYQHICVIGHEMGHGFGFPHSNNADDDGDPYDNPWDVMSNSWWGSLSDGTYGEIGQHTISYHKNLDGWIPAGQRLEVTTSGVHTITIDHLALATTTNYRMATIAIPGGSRFYTVEVRDLEGYDADLPGNAVIIHEVDQSRQQPAWLVDPAATNDGSGEAAMWRVGETFVDAGNDISVAVISATPDGFQVTITSGDVGTIFSDGFESGDTTAWSSST